MRWTIAQVGTRGAPGYKIQYKTRATRATANRLQPSSDQSAVQGGPPESPQRPWGGRAGCAVPGAALEAEQRGAAS